MVPSLCKFSQLTAKCVSSLLEHLLEGDELLVKQIDDDAPPPPNTKPGEPQKEHLAVRPPSRTAPHAAPSEQKPEAADASAEVANSQRENTPEDARLSASAAPPKASDICSSLSQVTPMILVGFGTGANSLLHLAAGPLRQEGSEGLGRGGGGDGGKLPCDDVGGECNDTGGGLLASSLYRKGFRVGGLVLVNGFISLDEQSTQARGPSRLCGVCTLGCSRGQVSGLNVGALPCP